MLVIAFLPRIDNVRALLPKYFRLDWNLRPQSPIYCQNRAYWRPARERVAERASSGHATEPSSSDLLEARMAQVFWSFSLISSCNLSGFLTQLNSISKHAFHHGLHKTDLFVCAHWLPPMPTANVAPGSPGEDSGCNVQALPPSRWVLCLSRADSRSDSSAPRYSIPCSCTDSAPQSLPSDSLLEAGLLFLSFAAGCFQQQPPEVSLRSLRMRGQEL